MLEEKQWVGICACIKGINGFIEVNYWIIMEKFSSIPSMGKNYLHVSLSTWQNIG